MTPLAAGALAGLALAVPIGAIGVLLVQEGATRGLRRGAAAAAAVATVDLLYCLAAVSAGATLAPTITAWGSWPRILGGVLLITLAARGLVREARPAAAGEAPRAESSDASSMRRYAVFFALTAINPATLIYFAAVVTALPSVVTSRGAAALFVLGVAVASLGWQSFLVGLGAALRWKIGDRFTRITRLVGNITIALFGILLVTGAALS